MTAATEDKTPRLTVKTGQRFTMVRIPGTFEVRGVAVHGRRTLVLYADDLAGGTCRVDKRDFFGDFKAGTIVYV